MPKLTIKKPGPVGLARLHSVYHNKIVFTYGFVSIALSTAIFITTRVYINNQSLIKVYKLLQISGVNNRGL